MATMSGSRSTATTTTPPTSTFNPLLIEDILHKLFPYFEDGRSGRTLASIQSIREVCKTWHQVSALAVKKNLRWRIGPYESSEENFLKDMASMADEELSRTIRNFNFYHRKSNENPVSQHVDQLLQEFGPYIVDMQLKSRDVDYVRAHLKASFLQNLEKLELYDISSALLQDKTLFDKDDDCVLPVFPKLKSLCFNPDIHQQKNLRVYDEGEAKICFNILRACPALKELEINLKKTNAKILCDESIDLSGLRSFKTALKEDQDQVDSSPCVVFSPRNSENLRKKCPNLKVLALTLSGTRPEICKMIWSYARQLEELHVSIADVGESYDYSDSEDEVLFQDEDPDLGEGDEEVRIVFEMRPKRRRPQPPWRAKSKMTSIVFPHFPLLKKFRMLSWFYTDLNSLGSMPALKEVDLKMEEGVTFDPPPAHVSATNYPTVTYLKFRGGTHRTRNIVNGGFPYFLRAPQIVALIATFPNVAELDVELADDDTLRTIINTLGAKLKRLHLNKSEITDDGITGIPWAEEPEEVRKTYDNKKWSEKAKEDIITANRQFPFIGDLKGLQELTYKGFKLTSLSVEFGFIYAKNLTSLKLPPNKKRLSKPPGPRKYLDFLDIYNYERTDVSIRPLVDNLKYLVKLDVNDDTNIYLKARLWLKNKDEDEYPPNHYKYTSCGISSDDLAYISEKAPSLEIIYGELKEKQNSRMTNTKGGGSKGSSPSSSESSSTTGLTGFQLTSNSTSTSDEVLEDDEDEEA